MSPKSFVRQVRIALARETDAFRPATSGVRLDNFAGQVAAALGRVPIVVVPQPAQSADDPVFTPYPSKEDGAQSTEPVGSEQPTAEPTVPTRAPQKTRLRHTEIRRPQPPARRRSRAFLTVTEVASRLNVSKMAVYRMIHSGELAAIRVGRSFRVPEAAVEQMESEIQSHSDTV